MSTPLPTARRYDELVAARQSCRLGPRLRNPAVVEGGALDSDRIGAYSLWQGNLGARLLVVAQDFADETGFLEHEGWPGARVATNLTLVAPLREAGITIQPPIQGQHDDQIFLTNAVLCLKSGGMQSAVPKAYFQNCGQRFLRPLIELVAPRAVVTLGHAALDAVLGAYGMSRPEPLLALVRKHQVFDLPGNLRLIPVCQPSQTVQNTARSVADQRTIGGASGNGCARADPWRGTSTTAPPVFASRRPVPDFPGAARSAVHLVSTSGDTASRLRGAACDLICRNLNHLPYRARP